MKTAVAFGTFDGLHAGHLAVLNATKGYSRAVVTFKSPPKFSKCGAGQLMTFEDRLSCLKNLGIDSVKCLEFEKVKDMPPIEFLQFIKSQYDLGLVSCGYNFKFGKSAEGDTETLKDFCLKNNIEFICSNAVIVDGEAVSSSRIRDYIKSGEIEKANSFLYRPFSFTSTVQSGDRRGRTIGFPTINQIIPEELVIPKPGVYESSVKIGDKTYKSVSNIGFRPTYKTKNITSETHIIGFSGDLYGKEISVFPKKYLREEIKFKDIKELEKAIKNDISEVIK